MPDARADILSITDASSAVYTLPIYTESGRKGLKFTPRPYQPSDPKYPWRVPVHPFDGGVAADRLNGPPDTYTDSSDVDASNKGILVPSPLSVAVTLTNGNFPTKLVEFNSLIFILGGRYMYYYNPADNTVTEDKDFGVGKAAVDMAVFNNELVVAMGESEKIYTRNTAGTWTQATDNTFAIALGVVNSLLWRAESTNKISNCITAPRTLTSWVPASPNQYTVGSTTYAINTIIDFNGQVWVGKADGMYSATSTWLFENQTPQLVRYPHTDNCKGAFVAQGALWTPSAAGLLRVKGGTSLPFGPEKTEKPTYRFWVRGGIEFNGFIYLSVEDKAASGLNKIYKMIRDQYDPNKYTYHELIGNLASQVSGGIIVTTVATNPKLVFGHGQTSVRYAILGRGSGRDIDDGNYVFANTCSIITGLMSLSEDPNIPAIIQGAEVLCIEPHANDEIAVHISVNRETDSFAVTYSDVSAGVAAITAQTTYGMVRRYLATPTEAQMASIKVITNNSNNSSSKRIIRGIWLFGWSRPKIVDEIEILIPNDGLTLNALGGTAGKSIDELYQKFYDWFDTSEILTVELPDYDEDVTVKCLVSGVEMTDSATLPGYNEVAQNQRVLSVKLQRMFPLGLSS